MEKGNYEIYAGLGGGFGGALYEGTCENVTEKEAMDEAYRLSLEVYDSYAGSNGLPSLEDIFCDFEYYGFEEQPTEEEALEVLQETIEGWLDYYVVLVPSSND